MYSLAEVKIMVLAESFPLEAPRENASMPFSSFWLLLAVLGILWCGASKFHSMCPSSNGLLPFVSLHLRPSCLLQRHWSLSLEPYSESKMISHNILNMINLCKDPYFKKGHILRLPVGEL